jgi:selenocysteine-specific elongation factor
MKHVVIGTAGHIDHGKSALVRALTGTDPDRLKEEKERGITIDLGFAFLRDGEGLSLGFVDVPGHERFVKNMLAGVGGIDLVLLVVAADESVMPQTREHFEICRLLRVPRGVVALTKTDLVDEDLRELAALETRELVAGSFLEGAPVVEVSSRTGAGVEELKAVLFDLAKEVPGRSSSGLFRLPVDRVFSMKGFGTVVTGTLIAGSVKQDEDVELVPRGLSARVRGLQVHGEKREKASAGQRTAVNLQGVEVSHIERGDVLVRPASVRPTLMIDAELEVLKSSPVRIRDLTRVHLHTGTAQVLARVRVLGAQKSIAPGERGFVQLRLEAPVVALRRDRFILRRYSPLETIAGGVVLDTQPLKHSVSSEPVLEKCRALLDGSDASVTAIFVEERGELGISATDLASRLGLPSEGIGAVIEALAKQKQAFVVDRSPRLLVDPGVVKNLSSRVSSELERYQKKNPLLAGMPKSELRDKTARRVPAEIFDWLIARMGGLGQVRVAKELVATADHRIQMSDEEDAAKEFLVTQYRRDGYKPRSLSETAAAAKRDPKLLERVQRVLLRDGTLVQIAEGMVFHRAVLDELKEEVRGLKAERDRIDVAFFKEKAGVTRKHAIPLLEWLDRERVTRRAGNDRVIL